MSSDTSEKIDIIEFDKCLKVIAEDFASRMESIKTDLDSKLDALREMIDDDTPHYLYRASLTHFQKKLAEAIEEIAER